MRGPGEKRLFIAGAGQQGVPDFARRGQQDLHEFFIWCWAYDRTCLNRLLSASKVGNTLLACLASPGVDVCISCFPFYPATSQDHVGDEYAPGPLPIPYNVQITRLVTPPSLSKDDRYKDPKAYDYYLHEP